METKEVKKFYEARVGGSLNSYEYDRWAKNSQARASYVSTKKAIEAKVLPLIKGQRNVLELGPGPGTWTKVILSKLPTAKYTLLDISEEMLKQAKNNLTEFNNVEYVNSDILDYNSEKRFDLFFSSRIIEYVPDKSKAIKIVSRHLESGSFGFFITKTPQYKRLFSKKVKSEVHANQINYVELIKCLEGAECRAISVFNVTSIFPLLRSGFMDRTLTVICSFLPFGLSKHVSESYGVIFQKK